MKKFLVLSCLGILFSSSLVAQSVGVGTTTPNASAELDVTATNKGVLFPRLTNAQMLAIASPANGLLVYNTDSLCFAYRTGSAWVFLKGNATASNDWSTKGNAGTDTSRNFMGTTDNVDLVFKRNNQRAGLINRSDGNTSWGAGALNVVITGFNNTAVGTDALAVSTGQNNTATGYRALYQNISGNSNVANGAGALYKNISGFGNIANGNQALWAHKSGNYNVAAGYQALLNDTAGSSNIALGTWALYFNQNGFSNVAIGTDALSNNTDRSNLVAIGDSALFYNGVGAININDASANTAVGSKSLYANRAGHDNTSVGYNTLRSNTSGNYNTAMGSQALSESNAGNSNSAFGYNALRSNNGYSNVAVGQDALRFNTNGNGNTAIGLSALNNTTGSNNTVVGCLAGLLNNGSNNVFVGYQAGQLEGGSNKLYISNAATDSLHTLIYGEFDNKLLISNSRMQINSDNTGNNGLRVIKNFAPGTNSNVSAVYGENTVDDTWGVGVEGKGGRIGVQGQSQGTGIIATYAGVKGIADGSNQSTNLGIWGQASNSAIANKGVTGEASGSGSDNYGVYGIATGGGNTNYGVYGKASGAVVNYAGYFDGNVVTKGKLTVTTTAGSTGLDLAGSDAYAEMRVIRNTLNATDKDLYLGFGSPVGSSVHLYSDGSETVLVKTNLIGVGKTPLTSSDDSRLQVKQIGLQNGIGIESANNTNHWDFYVTGNATSDLRLYYNGSIKGTFDNVTGAYAAASDRRLKKDITQLQPALNNVMQLQAYQYHYLDNQPTDRFSNGFMAQDVQKIFPDAVVESTMKDGEIRLGINYQYFTVLAIKSLQEQQQQIQSQEERITKLEALVKKLMQKN